MNKEERLDALMEEGGIEGCGNSQNCVRSCPKGIPLYDFNRSNERRYNEASVQEMAWILNIRSST